MLAIVRGSQLRSIATTDTPTPARTAVKGNPITRYGHTSTDSHSGIPRSANVRRTESERSGIVPQ